MSKNVTGFTLIELMVVLAVMAIILVIAIPSYSDYMRRSRRTEAIARMQDIALMQEKFRSESAGYTSDWNRLGGDPDAAPFDVTVGKFYNWGVAIVAANPAAVPPVQASYTITVTAQGDQTKDNAQGVSCSPLTLTSAGVKGPDVRCWR